MGLSMKATGKMISSMEMESKLGQMVLVMKAITRKARNTEEEFTFGVMDLST